MKNAGLILLVCCAVVLELSGPPKLTIPEHTALALQASTTVGHLHIDLRKESYGPVRVSLAYGTPHRSSSNRNEYAQALSLTLGVSNQTA